MTYKTVTPSNNLPRNLVGGDKPLIEFREISPRKAGCSREGSKIYGGFHREDFESVYLGQSWVEGFWKSGYDASIPLPTPCWFNHDREVVRMFIRKMLTNVSQSSSAEIRNLANDFEELAQMASGCYAGTRWNHGYSSRGEGAKDGIQALIDKAHEVRLTHHEVTCNVLQMGTSRYNQLRNVGQYLGELGQLVSIWHALILSEGNDTRGVFSGSLLVVHFTENGMHLFNELKDAMDDAERESRSDANEELDEYGEHDEWTYTAEELAVPKMQRMAEQYGTNVMILILNVIGHRGFYKGIQVRKITDALAPTL